MKRQFPYVAGMPVEFLNDGQAAVYGGVFSGPPSVAELDKSFLLDADREPVEVTGDPYTVGAVRLFTPVVNLGSVDRLIQHPASLSHHILGPDARAASGSANTCCGCRSGSKTPTTFGPTSRSGRASDASIG